MHEHQPTCLQETLQKWVKKRKAEEVTRAEPEPKAIPRYGRLLKTYYPLLELLPTAALPPRPPSGKHQFTLKWSNSRDVPVPVQIICDLRGSWRVVHKNRTRTFVFYDDNICNAWNLAKETASYWESHPPHPREHDKPEPAAAARESREGEGHSLMTPIRLISVLLPTLLMMKALIVFLTHQVRLSCLILKLGHAVLCPSQQQTSSGHCRS